jgi:two-component system, chemotaxis family, chemotaxis protein CheY
MSTILVVDDSMMVRTQVSRALTGAGFSVIEATEGEDALKKLGAKPETALVVCDVNMPRMNGIELLEAAATKHPTVAFLMLTTEGQPALIQKAKSLGAKGWMVKPFKADLLVAAVRKLTS